MSDPNEPLPRGLIASALAIADRAVIADIETEGISWGRKGDRIYDIRPLIDEREHSHETIDMAEQALGYAVARGLIVFERTHLARIVAPRGH